MSEAILETRGLGRTFTEGGRELRVLDGVDTSIAVGEKLAILGRSGSGKSTLLHLIGGLDTPTEGQILYRGTSLHELPEKEIDAYRRTHVGLVFQFYHLLPELNAVENVLIGGLIAEDGRTKSAIKQRAESLLERVGLKDRMKHRPAKLSGGERQRVAIARALINEPDVLLADEPTGNLDADTGRSILELFHELHAEGQTMVLVTHDDKVAEAADRVVTLVNGRLAADLPPD
ncbi:ABC transporter ATP-binding protein [Algisphaera agarilytica]|uniref:ABC-type lipoprotein export system ATPase subunit n=1 Tax=Algisphaera agarilytica TaxID=1385975 RepID=A0A7X0H6S0_9BACT|nr:ABC transporter ATP-binding protein [Algisphaera agarilytica]MBB6430279.1 ABC-type lipoprotein export system ATPase subunit [Algisphaera agarilytica]